MEPLEGLKVIDFSRVLSGPYCTMVLSDLGASVTKIERPGKGDDTREWGPPFIGEEAAYFLAVNRNKRSVTLDFKKPESRDIVYRMVEDADIVVENFRPGTADRLGIGYRDLCEINPRLIYCSISGFGQTGPYKDKPGYDAIGQAMGGLMSVTGYPDLPPVRYGVAIADIGAAMWALVGILSALRARETTGRGQHVETSLLEGQISWLTYVAANYFATGEVPARLGSAHPNIVPYQTFATKDGFVMIAVGNDTLWRRFTQALGLGALTDDPRFRTNRDRAAHREELIGLLSERLEQRTTDEWTDTLEGAEVPVGRINTVEDVFRDPHVLARDMLEELEHPTAGPIRVTGIPVKFSETAGAVKSAPPLLGQHTEEVLSELGYSEADIARLKEESVV